MCSDGQRCVVNTNVDLSRPTRPAPQWMNASPSVTGCDGPWRNCRHVDRATVVLRVIEDLSVAETASLLGVSPGTVKTQLSRGIERLRTALDDREEQ